MADLFSRVFSKLFARGPHMASRSNRGSSHPYVNVGRSVDRYPKLKIYISVVTLDSHKYIPVA